MSKAQKTKQDVFEASKKIAFVVLMVLGAAACGPAHTPLAPPPNEVIPAEEPPSPDVDTGNEQVEPEVLSIEQLLQNPDQIDYFQVSRLVLEPHCVSCHKSNDRQGGVDLSGYELVFGDSGAKRTVFPGDLNRSTLYETITTASGTRHMPPVDRKQLSPEQKKLVGLWVARGAQWRAKRPPSEGVVGTDPTDTPDEERPVVEIAKTLKEELAGYLKNPLTIDYPVVQKHVFKPHCTKCHSTEETGKLESVHKYSANMTSYKTLLGFPWPQLIDTESGNPDEMALFRSVVTSMSMPPRESYDPVPSLKMKLLRLWLLNCAVEDHKNVENERLLDPHIIEENGFQKWRLCKDQ